MWDTNLFIFLVKSREFLKLPNVGDRIFYNTTAGGENCPPQQVCHDYSLTAVSRKLKQLVERFHNLQKRKSSPNISLWVGYPADVCADIRADVPAQNLSPQSLGARENQAFLCGRP